MQALYIYNMSTAVFFCRELCASVVVSAFQSEINRWNHYCHNCLL